MKRPAKETKSRPAVDFREIPIHSGDGNISDAFELFMREFFEAMKFRIIEHPARGRDGGRDAIVEELLVGSFVTQPMRWIVSAKHFAHSGRSVGLEHEIDPKGRVDGAHALGFIGFYSTIASSSLKDRLAEIFSGSLAFKIFDRAAIEACLVTPEMEDLFRRFFPESWSRWHDANERRFIVAAEADPIRPEDEVAIDLTELLDKDGTALRFSDPDIERSVTAAVVASDIRQGHLTLLEKFVSFHPTVWRYLIVFLREQPPDERRFAAAITRTHDPFVLRLLISLAGLLGFDSCAKPICEQTLNCGYYEKQLRDRGYDFGISPFATVAKRTLSAFGAATIPLLDEYLSIAKQRRLWKAKGVFESALASFGRR